MKRKKIAVAALIALSPTLFAMVHERHIPSDDSDETRQQLFNYVLHEERAIEIYGWDHKEPHMVFENVLREINTLPINKDITPEQLKPIVLDINRRFDFSPLRSLLLLYDRGIPAAMELLGIDRNMTPEQLQPVVLDIARLTDYFSPLRVQLLLYGSGIPAAKELLDSTPGIHERLKELINRGYSGYSEGSTSFWEEENYAPSLAFSIFKYDPSLAADPEILRAVLKQGSPYLLSFLLQQPEIREEITKKGLAQELFQILIASRGRPRLTAAEAASAAGTLMIN